MRHLLLALLLFCSVACGSDKPERGPTAPDAAVKAKFETYLRLSVERQAPLQNWVDSSCDSFLFSGLRSAYSFVELKDGFLGKGRIGRRNHNMFANCLDVGASASDASQDGLLGLAEHVLSWPDQRYLAGEVLDYILANGGRVGLGDPGRTTVNPDVLGTLAQIAGRDIWQAKLPVAVGPVDGFRRHLMAMHLHIRAKHRGGMQEKVYHEWLTAQANSQPHNPLYAMLVARYVTGDYSETYRLLIEETYWPGDRLPDSRNFCGGEWVIQRDMGKDWQPCNEESLTTWSGSDWLYVACYALGFCG